MFHLVIERLNATTLVVIVTTIVLVWLNSHKPRVGNDEMESGPLILQLVSAQADANTVVCADKFACYGFVVMPCASLVDLSARVRAAGRSRNGLPIAIFDGRSADALAVVSALRASNNGLGIVALTASDDEGSVIRLLHAGVDTCCVVSASPELLIAVVVRLMWRLGVGAYGDSSVSQMVSNSSAAALQSDQTTSWQLIDQGWALLSPEGHRVALTTGERAFLSTLLSAPHQQATHEELISAVNASYHNGRARTHQSRLGVMVSRMRRKFSQAGAPLPLKSVHNWGYMFVA